MKKYTLILGLGVMISLISCGGESTTSETTDSLAVQVDTSSVTAKDTTVSKIQEESTGIK